MNIADVWHVMSNGKRHNFFYGPLDEYDYEDLEGFIEVPYAEWSANDFAEILGNIIEDRNHHWMIDIPSMLVSVMAKVGVSREQQDDVMRLFSERMVSEKFK